MKTYTIKKTYKGRERLVDTKSTESNIKRESVTPGTSRELHVSVYNETKYAGYFRKYVKGILKIDATIQCEMIDGVLTMEEARDAIRLKSFPADTYQSIAKQINELYKA